VDVDFESLYNTSIADRLAEYLSVDDEAIAAIESPWHRVTHVEAEPGPDAAELLPYVVNDLSLVKVKTACEEEWSPTEAQRQTSEALTEFARSPSPATEEARPSAPGSDESEGSVAGGGDFLRSASVRRSTRRSDGLERPDAEDSTREDEDTGEAASDAESARGVPGEGGYMPLPESDALERAWIGDRTPVEGTKLLAEAFEHDAAASEDGAVEITVVCNDEEMREEWDAAAEIYADREDLRANVTCEFDVSTDRLRDLLAEDNDMFHFIGHIDGHGFQCADGIVDAEEIEATGAKTVLLNGCRSHDQGIELVKSGARAAVVSLADLWNAGAVEVGETLARLFFHGFSIGSAMKFVRQHTSLGKDYVVVGDPGVVISQCENGLPTIYYIDNVSEESGEVDITPHTYPTRTFSIGSTYNTYFPNAEKRYTASGTGYRIQSTMVQVRQVLDNSEPLVVDNELTWADSWFGI
jgi:hypothetical protein